MIFFHSRLSFRSRRRSGAALVEFALVISILLVVVFGIIDFSVYGSNSLRLSNAAREGARAAAVGKTVEEIQARATRFAAPLALDGASGSIDLRVSRDGGANYNDTLTNNSSGTANAATADQYVRVKLTATNKSVTGALGILFNRSITSQVVMRREGSG